MSGGDISNDIFPPGWPIESDWSEHLQQVFETESFQQLQSFVNQQRQTQSVYPPIDEVFNAFRFTPYADTSVVVLGQDPYHGSGQAHGLSFSVAGECKFPPSLRNIFKELAKDLGVEMPTNRNLESWAQQGVLLLNTVLTVREADANSHRKQGWEKFTDEVIGLLGQRTDRKIAFLLWGKPAEKKANLIGQHHSVFISPHPSPLSAHRGFFGSRPFSKINESLIAAGREPIRWESICESTSV